MYVHKNGMRLDVVDRADLNRLKSLKDESWFGTHTTAILNSFQQENWFESIDNKNNMVFIVRRVAGGPSCAGESVGVYKVSNIDWVSRKYDSAHDVFKDHRGKGLSHPVLEAGVDFGFEVLNMHRIDTEVLENNIASFKSVCYVGYQKEGVKRKAVYKCGDYLDSVVFGIVREDWEQLDRVKEYGGICNVSYNPKNNKERGGEVQ